MLARSREVEGCVSMKINVEVGGVVNPGLAKNEYIAVKIFKHWINAD